MRGYPDAWWELAELVGAGAPEDVVKGYRAVLCPRTGPRANKRIDAKSADNAIRAGKNLLHETDLQWAVRQDWYVSHGLPVVAAHHWNDITNKRAAMLRDLYSTHPHTLLIWDNEGVDRTNVTPAVDH